MHSISTVHPSGIQSKPGTPVPMAVEPPRTRTSVASSWASDRSSLPPPYELYDLYPPVPVAATDSLRSHSSQTEPPRHTAPGSPRSPRKQAGNLSIPHLREALNSLESKMATLLSERDILESRLEQAVRLQSPVQRLPNELLASIFIQGVLDMEEEDSLMLSSLMLVCRYWKEVAINTPILWSRVVAGTRHSLGKVRRKLERSKSVPLHVCVDFSPRVDNENVSTANIILAMDLLQTSIWRWKSFRLTVPNRPQAHAALTRCQEEAPLLEILSIRILHSMQEDHFPHRAPLPLFEGRTPCLKSCSFTSFNFGWDMKLLSRLRVLKLGGYWNGFSPSVDTILGILKACPSLEEFALRNMSDVDPDSCSMPEPDHSEHERTSDSRIIRLQRLRKLSFYYAGIVRTRTIMSLLSFPALETIELSFLDNVSPVIEHLRRQSLTSLPLRRMRIESCFFNELKMVRLLRRLPSITMLEFIDAEDATSNLLKTLSTPPTAQTWICPRLTSLALEGCTNMDWEALRTFVESRLPAHARAYPTQLISSASAVPTQCQASNQLGPSTTFTSSASAFAAKAHILAHIPATTHAKMMSDSVGWPLRLQSIDLTRCHQISKEMVQWLRMYVAQVRCEIAAGIWGEASTT
ncbi:unnamed protein product [Somion occarium]|uniref:F-box domain-containing protein n=2 Tax=Somion occarium TaxID=3059160 RepID=A0ABP1E010_9APHY